MKSSRRPLIILAMASAFLGCSESPRSTVEPDSATAAPAADSWLGQWNGPEGTFLRLEGGKGRYDIIIQDLDGPQTYEGVAAGDQVQFNRNGVTESIRATNGTETGMKWLSDKSNCLTIRTGEGYCRE